MEGGADEAFAGAAREEAAAEDGAGTESAEDDVTPAFAACAGVRYERYRWYADTVP